MTGRRAALLALRLALTALFIGLVVYLVDLRAVGAVLSRCRIGSAALIAVLLPSVVVVLAVRWRMVLRAAGFEVPLRRVAAVTYAGLFFNLVLPGAAGGDIARAILAAQGEERRAAVVGTILLDRLIGLATMILMAFVVMIPMWGRPELRPVALLVVGLGAGGLAAFFVYFSRLGKALRDRLPFQGVVGEIHKVLAAMKDSRGVVLRAVALSVVAQSISIVAILGLSRALGLHAIPAGAFFVVEPIVFIVTAVPISPGGLGVQELAHQMLFRPYGVADSEAVALSLLYKVVLAAATIPGGLWFAAGGTRKR